MVVGYQIKTRNLDQFNRGLFRIRRNLNHTSEKIADRILSGISSELSVTVPSKTGRLKGSFRKVKRRVKDREGDRLVASIETNVPYASFVEFGTGIRGEVPPASGQLIKPKGATRLAWVQDGRVVMARYTRGQRPKKFLEHAIQNADKRLEGVAEIEVRKLISNENAR